MRNQLRITDTPITSIVIPDSGRVGVTATGHRLLLLDLNTGSVAQMEGRHSDVITTVAITAEGDLAVSGAEDGTVALWRIRNRSLAGIFSLDAPITSVAISSTRPRHIVAGDVGGAAHFFLVQDEDAESPSIVVTG